MGTLEKRLTDLENKQTSTDLSEMTVEQLDTQLATLEAGTPGWFGALLACIWRKGSRLPISTTPNL